MTRTIFAGAFAAVSLFTALPSCAADRSGEVQVTASHRSRQTDAVRRAWLGQAVNHILGGGEHASDR